MEYPQYDYAVIGGDMRQVYLTEEWHTTRTALLTMLLWVLPMNAGIPMPLLCPVPLP